MGTVAGGEKRRRGPKTADELMAELEADPEYRQRIAARDAAHRERVAENANEFALVRQALDEAGLPSEDFGRFTSGRHPDVIRPSVFDFRAAVPVLLDVLPRVTRPAVKEAVVRSLSTAHARPAAASALLQDRIVPALQSLLEDEDVALHAMAGLRRRLGPAQALVHIRPLTSHPSERIRRAATQQVRRAEKSLDARQR